MNNFKTLEVVKQDINEGISTESIIELFNTNNDLETIRNAVRAAKDRIYFGWATVDIADNAKEKIPIDEAIKEQEIYMKRGGPIQDSHTNAPVGKTLAYKIMVHPKSKTLGILHLNQIFDDNPKDNLVWEKIQSGEYTGSSVGGVNQTSEIAMDETTGSMIKELKGFHHYETSAVRKPCNPLATNEAVSLVAKEDTCDDVKKPKELDDRVQSILSNPDFKYLPGKSREESAFAIATEQLKKEQQANDINKKQDNKPKEETTMSEEISKQDEMLNIVKSLASEFAEMKKEMSTMKEDMKKPAEEEKEEEIEKENAVVDQPEGASDAPQPESPAPSDSNETDVFKEMKELVKEMKELKKASTPKVEAKKPETNELKKEDQTSALDIALGSYNKNTGVFNIQKGDKKEVIGYNEINKMMNE